MEPTNQETRIPCISGAENDVHSRARKLLCFADRPGVVKKSKRTYNKRLRKHYKKQTQEYEVY